ncbi:MAG TPA: hypothetical protein VNZ53_50335 [Steroidobacteraceae bacterium]|jgi:hypothetical protein|nr:hypothetical protein [Steroidobacteraceae bacterium]
MLDIHSSNAAPLLDGAAQCSVRERILLGLVLFTLVRTGEALAGDHASIPNVTLNPGLGDLRPSPFSAFESTAAPGNFAAPPASGVPAFSTTEFRPRHHAAFDSDTAVSAFGDAPMLRSTTVWQRMAEYKSQNRVRVLTLWESSGSTVSLQAGRRGDPSLQWTSRLMNRGGSTQGLLDRLFSVSFAGANRGFRNAARSANAPPAPMSQSAGTPAVAQQRERHE